MWEPTPYEKAVAASPMFKGFCEAISEEFRFLETEFLFQPSEPRVQNYEWKIDYRNETIRITPFYELGSLPTVDLYRRKVAKHSVIDVDLFDINFLIATRCPERRLTGFQPVPFSGEDFAPIYRHYAGVLRECAADVLRGDFSIVPEIHKLAERERSKRYREWKKKEKENARKQGQ